MAKKQKKKAKLKSAVRGSARKRRKHKSKWICV